ncbi:MAG: hypothetical protein A3D96_06950 [Chlamydiae bacterium RIFCSPHIGHO2_12_FULL_44_59]|nr:MAG: hypothetical protein A2796_05875 [Chlamydiae bacterium RIFCSPHIGHO2_01_FULL_44_39]OGN57456.1 MAG: hypothetical protein A3C42_04360 [Chlamydiae bacterium RIFCSPHIGHO2_02_FULL_45_9]OGN60378.1 MAG: hypothetical protein A3D96_06950 [Chlamydiae bacterium RIFCSPHIGHO2_12_FULL_44_59]OGN66363.1 MAG: hypothetical protein A2978_07010 [Chlamydiae bacterium RIFCSPLOWO2_01_FULL_44_52]OGN69396.1 MAG: hypothetical protein A3I67_06530 [Chlamydiae bacterium RIFCSPLOWO2_02_FULL_45_22]OGN70549.1 MAG: hyp
MKPFYWEFLSKKLRLRLDRLLFVGSFTADLASERGMRFVSGKAGGVRLDWLVDETDGIIADVKFQAFGPVGLIAACEVVSELVLRKNYNQASRITAELIDQHVRDRKEVPAFPKECDRFLNQALSAVDQAVEQCSDIPFNDVYDTTPIEIDFSEIPGGLPGWDQFALEKKIALIQEVMDKEIRPYIELDAGGVMLIDLKETGELIISYQGACTSCHASTGSTLSAIQKILRARVHPSLFVTPKL